MRLRPATAWRQWASMAVAAVAAAALLASLGASPVASAHAAVPAPPAGSGAGVETHTVGLLTGDTVTLHGFAGGRRGVEVDLADRDGDEVGYDILEEGSQTYVIPTDALPLIPDRLDRELFNVTKLVDYGYDRAHGLPVIVAPGSAGPRSPVANLESTAGVQHRTALPSVGAEAVTVDSGNPAFWRAVSRPSDDLPARELSGPLAGVGKIWLDEQVEATLDQSAPMVGAPAARAAGYDGSGLTVAVLDTGIDVAHPDFAGRIAGAETFLPTGTAADGHGHGTHVAGIVAGGGDASGGKYAGVAPGATLLSGKVLGDNGAGQTSWIIQGMEWAAGSGADVVNMSLGSSNPSNGFDLLSGAVNRLTEQHDVLFVTSAGNLGPGSWTVSSPGAASAALTVGAVDSSGDLARFSSRGPRLVPAIRHLIGGEFAIKPDITAPGVGIASARAGGTSLGAPVNGHYTRLSGTSMAAPHVAGAAAIVLQQRPELSAAGLKSALVTTAVPHGELTVYQQGGGRLDIPAALESPVATSSAPLDFGSFTHPYDQTAPVSTGVTYTNLLDQATTLDLSFDVTSPEAGAASAALLQVAPARLDLAAGESAEVTVTLDPRAGEFGSYGGALVAATGDSVVSRIPTGFWLEPPTYTLTIEGIDRRGNPAGGPLHTFDVVDAQDLNTFTANRSFFNRDGTVTVEVPHGTYAVVGRFQDPDPVHGEELSIVSVPQLPVTGDRTVVLDARTANQVTVATPEHDTSPLPHSEVTVGFQRETAAGQHFARAFTAPATAPIYLAEAEAPTLGDLSVFSRRLLGTEDGTVLYDLVLVESDGIPEDLHSVVDTDQLAAVTNRYHSDLPHQVVQSTRFVELPGWESLELGVTHAFNAPAERTDYYLAGQGAHRQRVNLNGSTLPTLFTEAVTYTAGERRSQSWFARPIGPGLRPDEPTVRAWNTLQVEASPWVDPGGHAFEGPVDFAFFQDGELVRSGTNPGALPLSGDPAEYRLELSAAADRSWWQTATAATTAWTLQSAPPPDGGPEVVPLLLLDYDIELSGLNTAPLPGDRRGPPVIGIHARHQTGAERAPIAGARLWTSYDDGATWRQRSGRSQGHGQYEFVVDMRDPADTSGFMSLRVEAWDAAGNRIEQEITRAYRLPPREAADPEPEGTTERVSVASNGTQANGTAQGLPTVSADGRFVAFSSQATNLVPGDQTLAGGAFVRDRDTGVTERVSVASDGTPATGLFPAITPDGRFAAFASTSPDLVAGKTTTRGDVFVHDRETGVTERVSVASDGTEGDAGASSSRPAISADGRYVAFQSSASNLVPGDTNSSADVFVHDRETGGTERVSVASDGAETGRFTSSSDPAISADGRYVAFQSSGSNLVPGDTNGQSDIFMRDREAGRTERVSVATGGTQADSFSANPAISADGRYLAFQSFASNLAPGDTNGQSDVFVHDRQTGVTERVSVATGGTQGNGFASGPAISADGRYAGFASGANNLVPGDTNAEWDIFVHDRQTGATERVSVAGAGSEGNQTSGSAPALSAAGEHVVFTSSASNLVPGDTNSRADVFLRDRGQE